MDVMEPSQLSLQHQESELMSQERTSAHLAPPGSALAKINWVKNEKNLEFLQQLMQITSFCETLNQVQSGLGG